MTVNKINCFEIHSNLRGRLKPEINIGQRLTTVNLTGGQAPLAEKTRASGTYTPPSKVFLPVQNDALHAGEHEASRRNGEIESPQRQSTFVDNGTINPNFFYSNLSCVVILLMCILFLIFLFY